MKHILTAIAILFAVSTQAQKIDTVKNAIQVQPVVVNALSKDTCYQLSWNVFGIQRDTVPANSYVQLYDRKGKRVSEMNVPIPYSVLSVWLEDKIIDDYILTFLGLKKRN